MAFDPYTIRINGGAETPIDVSSNQILSFTREQNSLASSFLKIATSENFSAASQWQYGSTFELFLSGTRIFIGTVVDPTYIATFNGQGRQYVIECPWRRFRRTPYEQPFANYADDGGFLGRAPTSFASLFFNISTATQMQVLVNYLITDQTGFLSAPVNGETLVGIVMGTVDATIILRPTKVIDTMVSEIAQHCAQFLPDSVSWWDWTQPLPAFNWRTSDTFDTVAIPLAKPATKWQAQKSTETKVAFVRLILKVQQQIPGVSGYGTVLKEAFYPPGYTGPIYGGVSIFQQLTSVWNIGQASTFSSTLYNSCARIGVKGSVEVTGPSGVINTALRPGVIIPVPAGEAAGLNGIVYKTTDDLKTGKTAASFNPPRPVSIQALMAMIRQAWPPESSNEQQEQQTGQSQSANYGMGDNSGEPGAGSSAPSTAELEVEGVVNVGGVATPETIQILVPGTD